MRIGVNSGSLPKHLHELERENPVEALVTAAVEFVELMERLRVLRLQGLDQVDQRAATRSPPTGCCPSGSPPAAPRHHRGGHEVVGLAEERGRPRHAARRRHRRHDPHLALDLPRRGGGQGRLGDPQGAQAARARPGADRLPDLRAPAVRHGHRGRPRSRSACEAYDDPIEVAVLGCAVNGIGEASHADFGITGAKDKGLIFSPRQAAAQGAPRSELVDVLFEEIDKYAPSASASTSTTRGRRGRRAGWPRSRPRTPAR